MGQAYGRLGNTDKAIELLNEVKQKNPTGIVLWMWMNTLTNSNNWYRRIGEARVNKNQTRGEEGSGTSQVYILGNV